MRDYWGTAGAVMEGCCCTSSWSRWDFSWDTIRLVVMVDRGWWLDLNSEVIGLLTTDCEAQARVDTCTVE